MKTGILYKHCICWCVRLYPGIYTTSGLQLTTCTIPQIIGIDRINITRLSNIHRPEAKQVYWGKTISIQYKQCTTMIPNQLEVISKGKHWSTTQNPYFSAHTRSVSAHGAVYFFLIYILGILALTNRHYLLLALKSEFSLKVTIKKPLWKIILETA